LAPLDWACKVSSTQKSHASLVPAGRGFFAVGPFPQRPRAANPNLAFPAFPLATILSENRSPLFGIMSAARLGLSRLPHSCCWPVAWLSAQAYPCFGPIVFERS